MPQVYVIKVDGTEVLRGFTNDLPIYTFKDIYPAAGSRTITVEIGEHPQDDSGPGVTAYVGDRALKLTIFKR